jgi:hypothetical protein
MASHCGLQYFFPSLTVQEQLGCAHFLLSGTVSSFFSAFESILRDRVIGSGRERGLWDIVWQFSVRRFDDCNHPMNRGDARKHDRIEGTDACEFAPVKMIGENLPKDFVSTALSL